MKLLIFSALLIYISTSTYCQTQYLCKYNDSIGILNYEKQIESMRTPLMEKGMSPDIFDAYILKFFSDKNSFLITSERQVMAHGDSSIIDLEYTSNKSFQISFDLPSTRLKVEKGKLFRYNQSNSGYTESSVSDSAATFVKLKSQKRTILGYSCLEYTNLEQSVTIWVCEDLPSSINPGISVKNIRGAILAFEAKNGNGLTKSYISGLQKISKKSTPAQKPTTI